MGSSQKACAFPPERPSENQSVRFLKQAVGFPSIFIVRQGAAFFAPSHINARSSEMPDIHLHQIELARRWKLSPSSMERWRWFGEGPRYLKNRGRVLYAIEDVVAFEAAGVRSSTSGQQP
jgi:hypothetical protein